MPDFSVRPVVNGRLADLAAAGNPSDMGANWRRRPVTILSLFGTIPSLNRMPFITWLSTLASTGWLATISPFSMKILVSGCFTFLKNPPDDSASGRMITSSNPSLQSADASPDSAILPRLRMKTEPPLAGEMRYRPSTSTAANVCSMATSDKKYRSSNRPTSTVSMSRAASTSAASGPFGMPKMRAMRLGSATGR
ncbi:hypothetical protein HZC53_04825 [Candidatus Uhrbacteria bacterium]|nr:hypothetical protein [Candidatus Uhrbacteria bacterium]